MDNQRNQLQTILNTITLGSDADITILDGMNMVVASSVAHKQIGMLYEDASLIYEATEVWTSCTESDGLYFKDGIVISAFKYCSERYYVVFGKGTDRLFVNIFLLYFSEKAVDEQAVGSLSGMFYEVLLGMLNVSATIERADKLGFDFLSKCTPVLVTTDKENREVGQAIDTFIDSEDDEMRLKIMLSNTEIVLVYINENDEDIREEACALLDMIESECVTHCVIGIGRKSNNVFELADIYNELKLAVKSDPLFDGGKHIVSLDEYNVGRLIRELDEETCQKFVDEVMGDFQEEYEKDDYFSTINTFFKCNLNSSEAAREMFIHRNTLIYRLGKIKKMTGYDITNFDDAFIFKWATMLHKYLHLKKSGDAAPIEIFTDDMRRMDEV